MIIRDAHWFLINCKDNDNSYSLSYFLGILTLTLYCFLQRHASLEQETMALHCSLNYNEMSNFLLPMNKLVELSKKRLDYGKSAQIKMYYLL